MDPELVSESCDEERLERHRSFDRLEVSANPHAREFYKTMGFIVDGVVETEFYPGYRMHRTIR